MKPRNATVVIGVNFGDEGKGLAVDTLVARNLDAVVIRCLLMPATLHLIGERTWRLPTSLARLLPRINVEGGAAQAPRARGSVATEGVEG